MPFMGQGASQSIEDGLVLARCFDAHRDDPTQAIGSYVALRQERTAALQIASRDRGREVQRTEPAEIAARNARMREHPGAFVAGYDWIWGYDAASAVAGG
jgi:salicylate hydroxylase